MALVVGRFDGCHMSLTRSFAPDGCQWRFITGGGKLHRQGLLSSQEVAIRDFGQGLVGVREHTGQGRGGSSVRCGTTNGRPCKVSRFILRMFHVRSVVGGAPCLLRDVGRLGAKS